MTPLSRQILENYQVRKTNKQKEAFIRLMKQYFPELRIQEGGFPKCKNIIIGDIENSKVILSAHYDTCSQLPFPNFITPKNPLLSIGYSVLLAVIALSFCFLFTLLISVFISDTQTLQWINLAFYLGFVLPMFAGPANKHTANDNTSGVITLCELLQVLTPEERKNAAFVFFDHEETGLIGSALFRRKYKTILKDKLLINFDCVSDGDNILIIASKAARYAYGDLLKEVFTPTQEKSILFTNAEKTYYPSDQLGFKTSVAVAALKKKRLIGYYMDRIHTKNDTVFDQANIKLICDSIHKLLKVIR